MLIKSILLAATLMIATPSLSFAHSAIFDCYDNGDSTISCQGGYSDGSSATGVKIQVLDASGKVLESGMLDANSECTMKKPAGGYTVSFVGGDGHSLAIDGKNIVE